MSLSCFEKFYTKYRVIPNDTHPFLKKPTSPFIFIGNDMTYHFTADNCYPITLRDPIFIPTKLRYCFHQIITHQRVFLQTPLAQEFLALTGITLSFKRLVALINLHLRVNLCTLFGEHETAHGLITFVVFNGKKFRKQLQ